MMKHTKSEESYARLVTRAASAGLALEPFYYGDRDEYFGITLGLPSGRSHRTVRLYAEDELDALLAVDFENYRYADEYLALFHTGTGAIEAALTYSAALAHNFDGTHVWDLPGVKWEHGKSDERVRRYEPPLGWSLSVSNGEITAELSPGSAAFKGLHGRHHLVTDVTLKIQHELGSEGPRATELLDGVGRDWLFELDLQYHIGVGLAIVGDRRFSLDRRISASTPHFPRNAYSQEAHALYWYAADAQGFPLLQFLAYYQILEFYFSLVNRAAAIGRVRLQLKDPAFDPTSDAALGRLIDATADAHRGLTGEREQLRTTINTCVEEEEIMSWIAENETLKVHFCSRTQPIRGTRPLDLTGGQGTVRDQLATRVYLLNP